MNSSELGAYFNELYKAYYEDTPERSGLFAGGNPGMGLLAMAIEHLANRITSAPITIEIRHVVEFRKNEEEEHKEDGSGERI